MENTESLKIEISYEKFKAAMLKSVDDIIGSTYSNPIKSMVESAFKDKEGQVKLFVEKIIAETLLTPDFKTKMSEAIMNKMIESALRK
jgi:hypothetical protein